MRHQRIFKTLTWILVFSFAAQEFSFAGQQSDAAPAVKLPSSVAIPKISRFNGSSETIIHIEDAHDSLEAQHQIHRVLNILADKYDVRTVALEGSSGRVDPLLFRTYPDKDWARQSAERLMGEGHLSAGEFFAITSEKPLLVQGVEDKTLYQENLQALTELLDDAEELNRQAGALRKTLARLGERIFSPELRRILSHSAIAEEDGALFTEKWKVLKALADEKKIDLKPYPNLRLLSDVTALEERIHFDAANRERERLLKKIQAVSSEKEIDELLKKSIAFKAGKLSETEFHDWIWERAGEKAIDRTSYPELASYRDYLTRFERIDLYAIFAEAGAFENELKEAYYASEDERVLDSLMRRFEILMRLTAAKASPDDWIFFQRHRDSFGPAELFDPLLAFTKKHRVPLYDGLRLETFQEALPKAVRFYELAQRRDRILIENALRTLRTEHRSVAALVTGGFHAKGIADILDQDQLNHLVITPKITDPEKTRPYITILTRRAPDYREIFSEDESAYSLGLGTALDRGGANPLARLDSLLKPLAEGLRRSADPSGALRRWMSAYREKYRPEPSDSNTSLGPESVENSLREMLDLPAGARLSAEDEAAGIRVFLEEEARNFDPRFNYRVRALLKKDAAAWTEDDRKRYEALKAEIEEARDWSLGEANKYREIIGHPPVLLSLEGIVSAVEKGEGPRLTSYHGGLGVLFGEWIRALAYLGGVTTLDKNSQAPEFHIFIPDYEEGLSISRVHAFGYPELGSRGIKRPQDHGIDFFRDPQDPNIPFEVEIPIYEKGPPVFVRFRLVPVGGVKIIMPYTDFDKNHPAVRRVFEELYKGRPNSRERFEQEWVAGLSAYEFRKKLGLPLDGPIHLNETATFPYLIGMVRGYMEQGYTYDQALRLVGNQLVFFTHTLVAAGIDRFYEHTVSKGHYIRTYFEHSASQSVRQQAGDAAKWLIHGKKTDGGVYLPGFEETHHHGVYSPLHFIVRLAHVFDGSVVAVSQLNAIKAGEFFIKQGILTPEENAQKPVIGITNGVDHLYWMIREFREAMRWNEADAAKRNPEAILDPRDPRAPEVAQALGREQRLASRGTVPVIPDRAFFDILQKNKTEAVEMIRETVRAQYVRETSRIEKRRRTNHVTPEELERLHAWRVRWARWNGEADPEAWVRAWESLPDEAQKPYRKALYEGKMQRLLNPEYFLGVWARRIVNYKRILFLLFGRHLPELDKKIPTDRALSPEEIDQLINEFQAKGAFEPFLDRVLRQNAQFVFAGKTFSEYGRTYVALIHRLILRLSQKHPELQDRVLFLEGYDETKSQYLVRGADLWINTPKRPLEASGTSGMKTAKPNVNGDGWGAAGIKDGLNGRMLQVEGMPQDHPDTRPSTSEIDAAAYYHAEAGNFYGILEQEIDRYNEAMNYFLRGDAAGEKAALDWIRHIRRWIYFTALVYDIRGEFTGRLVPSFRPEDVPGGQETGIFDLYERAVRKTREAREDIHGARLAEADLYPGDQILLSVTEGPVYVELGKRTELTLETNPKTDNLDVFLNGDRSELFEFVIHKGRLQMPSLQVQRDPDDNSIWVNGIKSKHKDPTVSLHPFTVARFRKESVLLVGRDSQATDRSPVTFTGHLLPPADFLPTRHFTRAIDRVQQRIDESSPVEVKRGKIRFKSLGHVSEAYEYKILALQDDQEVEYVVVHAADNRLFYHPDHPTVGLGLQFPSRNPYHTVEGAEDRLQHPPAFVRIVFSGLLEEAGEDRGARLAAESPEEKPEETAIPLEGLVRTYADMQNSHWEEMKSDAPSYDVLIVTAFDDTMKDFYKDRLQSLKGVLMRRDVPIIFIANPSTGHETINIGNGGMLARAMKVLQMTFPLWDRKVFPHLKGKKDITDLRIALLQAGGLGERLFLSNILGAKPLAPLAADLPDGRQAVLMDQSIFAAPHFSRALQKSNRKGLINLAADITLISKADNLEDGINLITSPKRAGEVVSRFGVIVTEEDGTIRFKEKPDWNALRGDPLLKGRELYLANTAASVVTHSRPEVLRAYYESLSEIYDLIHERMAAHQPVYPVDTSLDLLESLTLPLDEYLERRQTGNDDSKRAFYTQIYGLLRRPDYPPLAVPKQAIEESYFIDFANLTDWENSISKDSVLSRVIGRELDTLRPDEISRRPRQPGLYQIAPNTEGLKYAILNNRSTVTVGEDKVFVVSEVAVNGLVGRALVVMGLHDPIERPVSQATLLGVPAVQKLKEWGIEGYDADKPLLDVPIWPVVGPFEHDLSTADFMKTGSKPTIRYLQAPKVSLREVRQFLGVTAGARLAGESAPMMNRLRIASREYEVRRSGPESDMSYEIVNPRTREIVAFFTLVWSGGVPTLISIRANREIKGTAEAVLRRLLELSGGSLRVLSIENPILLHVLRKIEADPGKIPLRVKYKNAVGESVDPDAFTGFVARYNSRGAYTLDVPFEIRTLPNGRKTVSFAENAQVSADLRNHLAVIDGLPRYGGADQGWEIYLRHPVAINAVVTPRGARLAEEIQAGDSKPRYYSTDTPLDLWLTGTSGVRVYVRAGNLQISPQEGTRATASQAQGLAALPNESLEIGSRRKDGKQDRLIIIQDKQVDGLHAEVRLVQYGEGQRYFEITNRSGIRGLTVQTYGDTTVLDEDLNSLLTRPLKREGAEPSTHLVAAAAGTQTETIETPEKRDLRILNETRRKIEEMEREIPENDLAYLTLNELQRRYSRLLDLFRTLNKHVYDPLKEELRPYDERVNRLKAEVEAENEKRHQALEILTPEDIRLVLALTGAAEGRAEEAALSLRNGWNMPLRGSDARRYLSRTVQTYVRQTGLEEILRYYQEVDLTKSVPLIPGRPLELGRGLSKDEYRKLLNSFISDEEKGDYLQKLIYRIDTGDRIRLADGQEVRVHGIGRGRAYYRVGEEEQSTPLRRLEEEIRRGTAEFVAGARLAATPILVGVKNKKVASQIKALLPGRGDIRVVSIARGNDPEAIASELEAHASRTGALFVFYLDEDDLNRKAKIAFLKEINVADFHTRPVLLALLEGRMGLEDLTPDEKSAVTGEIIRLLPRIAPKSFLRGPVELLSAQSALRQLQLELYHPSFGIDFENLVVESPKAPRAAVWTLPIIEADPFFFETLDDRDRKLAGKMILEDYVILREGDDARTVLGGRFEAFQKRFSKNRILHAPADSIEDIYQTLGERYAPENVLFIDRQETRSLRQDGSSLKLLILNGPYALTLDKVVVQILALGDKALTASIKGLVQRGNLFIFSPIAPLDFARVFKSIYETIKSTSESA